MLCADTEPQRRLPEEEQRRPVGQHRETGPNRVENQDGLVGEPPVECGRSLARVAAGHERLVIKLDPVEEGRGITRDHVARILVMGEDFGDKFIDVEHVWAGELDRTIPWCLDSHLGNRARDVLRRHRLEQ